MKRKIKSWLYKRGYRPAKGTFWYSDSLARYYSYIDYMMADMERSFSIFASRQEKLIESNEALLRRGDDIHQNSLKGLAASYVYFDETHEFYKDLAAQEPVIPTAPVMPKIIQDATLRSISLVKDTPENRAAGAHPIDNETTNWPPYDH